MYNVKFEDGTTLDVVTVLKTSAYIQGATRDALEIQLTKGSVTVDVLDALTADSAKTGEITITDDSGTYVHDNYCIRAELAIRPVVTAPATSTTPEVSENRLCVTLAQLTHTEVQIAAQAAAQAEAIAELSILVAGGNA